MRHEVDGPCGVACRGGHLDFVPDCTSPYVLQGAQQRFRCHPWQSAIALHCIEGAQQKVPLSSMADRH